MAWLRRIGMRAMGAMKVSAAFGLAMVGLVALAPSAPAQGVGGPPDRYVVVLNGSVPDPATVASEHARAFNARVGFVYQSAIKGYSAVIPNDRVAAIRNDPRVAFISPDLDVEAVQKSGGAGSVATSETTPTGVNRIGAAGKASVTNVAVAVIDTGSGPHSDLNVVGGRNCSTGVSYNDGNGHGTHVAGTIGAKANGAGVVGVAPGVPIYSVRVLNNAGSGTWSSVICGIDWVTANWNRVTPNIRVANMSLGGGTSENLSLGCSSSALHQAICNSVNAGVTYVVAAGNSATSFGGFVPAVYPEVLTVTAMSDSDGSPGGTGGAPSCLPSEGDDVPASFSNYAVSSTDKAHTIAGPGVCILSTWLKGGYNTISGTSMAAPHVSGTAALCIASGACSPSPSSVKSKLLSDASSRSVTAYFTGSPGTTKYYGYLVYAGGY